MKIGYQLKQVRERLCKGLVDKGILRTEKKNFLLFDMATHPVADGGAKEEIRRRVRNVLTNRTVVLAGSQFLPEELEFRYLRTITMVCAAYAANVLENALTTLGHEARERAFAQVDELLAEYSQYPFARRSGGSQGVGANLGQVITDEVNGSKDKELQLEVGRPARDLRSRSLTYLTGGLCVLECLHKTGLAALVDLALEALMGFTRRHWVPTCTTADRTDTGVNLPSAESFRDLLHYYGARCSIIASKHRSRRRVSGLGRRYSPSYFTSWGLYYEFHMLISRHSLQIAFLPSLLLGQLADRKGFFPFDCAQRRPCLRVE
jgi:hypothetical protein